MKFKIEKETIEALEGYEHEIINDEEDEYYITVEMDDINEIDNLAKETNNGMYYTCRIKKYGKTKIEDLFYNWLTEDWEHIASYHADIEEMTDEEAEEYQKLIEKLK